MFGEFWNEFLRLCTLAISHPIKATTLTNALVIEDCTTLSGLESSLSKNLAKSSSVQKYEVTTNVQSNLADDSKISAKTQLRSNFNVKLNPNNSSVTVNSTTYLTAISSNLQQIKLTYLENSLPIFCHLKFCPTFTAPSNWWRAINFLKCTNIQHTCQPRQTRRTLPTAA